MKIFLCFSLFSVVSQAFQPPTVPQVDIWSSTDFLSKTNPVELADTDSDVAELIEQNFVMQDRVDEIDYILPKIGIHKNIKLENFVASNLRMDIQDNHIFPTWTSSSHKRLASKDLLSPVDFMCIVNQIFYVEKDDISQKEAICNTLADERGILISRIAAIRSTLGFDDEEEEPVFDINLDHEVNSSSKSIHTNYSA